MHGVVTLETEISELKAAIGAVGSVIVLSMTGNAFFNSDDSTRH